MGIIYFLVLILSYWTQDNTEDEVKNYNDWNKFSIDSIASSLDNEIQRFYYYKSLSKKMMPLVVSLHQWSSDYTNFKNSLAPQVKERGWNYIHPDFRGPNNHLKACGSDCVISDIDAAIDWAKKNLSVDTTQIYIVGSSGGGYAALCHFMKSDHKVKEYSVWVPISDLKRWYFESKYRNPKYSTDIIKCVGKRNNKIDIKEAVECSPLYWETPVNKLNGCKLKIYAGIHDEYTGSLPIVHSLSFYNKIVEDSGGTKSNQVSSDEMIWMLTTRSSPCKIKGTIGNRQIHCFKTFKNVSLTIFEGGHEMLADKVLLGLIER